MSRYPKQEKSKKLHLKAF